MRSLMVLSCALVVTAVLATSADARREPRRSFVPIRGQTEARVDYRFRIIPPPPTRAQQLRPLPSFAAPRGFRGLHSGIWWEIRHARWLENERGRQFANRVEDVHQRGPLIIEVAHPATQPTTRPSDVIDSITIR